MNKKNLPLIFILILIFSKINFSQEERGEVLINSNPQDAYVFYNDSLVGNTPLFIPSEFQSLKLKKIGYEDYNLSINKSSRSENVSLKFNSFQREESFFERDIFKILTAGIIVLGGTTAYFKLKADNKFDEYEFSGESKYLDETRKYDLISGITFGALQINFGLLLYYFLTE